MVVVATGIVGTVTVAFVAATGVEAAAADPGAKVLPGSRH